MPALILLVETDRIARQRLEALLSDIGYLVAWVSSFSEAKELLDSVLPDLLIAAVRLEMFNGLHLAARSRHDYPNLPVIITHTAADPVLEAEAIRHGAHFVARPLENPEFLRLIRTALEEHRHRQRMIRRWPRKRVAGVVEAQLPTARARIHDMSYEGLRLAFGRQQELPAEFDLTLPTAGLTVKARRVWTSRSEATDEFWCGVKVAASESPASGDWRTFVDSL
jgi:DNA-binding NtrC family response regulator